MNHSRKRGERGLTSFDGKPRLILIHRDVRATAKGGGGGLALKMENSTLSTKSNQGSGLFALTILTGY